MEQEAKNTDDGLPVLAQQANNKENDKLPDPIHLTNATGTYLQQLNEHCLLEIFSVKSLTWMDLCSLAETCTLFETIIQRLRPKDLTIEIRYDEYNFVSRKYSHTTGRRSQDIERICKHFGHCLYEVRIHGQNNGEEQSNVLVNLVTEYCVDSLDSLRIRHMKIPAILAVKLKPIFKRLQLLDLLLVSIEECDQTLFADLDSLIELRVRGVDNDIAILDNIFPILERFTYVNFRDEFRFDHPLLAFISRNRSLKMLDIDIVIYDDVLKMNFLQVIVNSCKELEVLDLYLGPTNSSSLQPLRELQSLKTLKVHQLSCDDFKFVSAMTKLLELNLWYCDLPEDSNQFATLAQLTILIIRGGTMSDSFDVVGMIRRLENLEELTISAISRKRQYFEFDEETFSKIVAVAKARSTVLTLKCNFNFVLNSTSLDENRMVRLIGL